MTHVCPFTALGCPCLAQMDELDHSELSTSNLGNCAPSSPALLSHQDVAPASFAPHVNLWTSLLFASARLLTPSCSPDSSQLLLSKHFQDKYVLPPVQDSIVVYAASGINGLP